MRLYLRCAAARLNNVIKILAQEYLMAEPSLFDRALNPAEARRLSAPDQRVTPAGRASLRDAGARV